MVDVVKEFIKHKREYFLYIVFLVVTIIICTAMMDILWEITSELKGDRLPEIDHQVSAFFFSFRSETLTSIVIAITTLGGKWGYLSMLPISILLLYRNGKSWKLILPATIILASTLILNQVMKFAFNRQRPSVDDRLTTVADWSLSYPSGHSMLATAFYGFMIYTTYKYVRPKWLRWTVIVFLVFLTLSISASRVYLGVHYASDVVAGMVAGLIWLAICIVAIRTMNLYRRRRDRKLAIMEANAIADKAKIEKQNRE